MALPLAPIAAVAMKYGALALAGYALTRQVRPGHIAQPLEDAMDTLPEGICITRPRDAEQMNGTARLRRIIRLGHNGRGVELDAAFLARIKLRWV
ncbi:hypothetical protein [Roseinatronobacter alkalisoli]|uniref:Uncharacterized protein n=1 Tax=Roseinatronobacter alkalisoli TaxID=3028235 RepID=A0ABT5TAD6_9RHOB|nr:hypothetical protein [Roseinatronobacter sp. HJB301]MDD7972089.1 hypothetical protein [Roseinatronobacter sp. HJB301]